ncbi:hypothetical protein O181_019730 [Austropuccinia psidii MF-1]|uniref:Uncharacterized protein n=1 Tax=Austropuccinia psidii MF-1 TaxID=1389203 RepID=A0A9Q3CCE1_9BASI|nr:hypothetical protein [Austropuccinia psidii MF-1]
MPVKYSPPKIQTLSQAKAQAVLTPTPRAITLRGPGEYDAEEKEKYVEEEESDSFVASPAPLGESQGTGGPNLVHSDQLVSHKSEKSLLAIMQQVTQIITNLQAASLSEGSRPPSFNTLSMKASECFDWTQPSEFRSFIQSFQLILYNYKAKFSKDRKEALCST